MLRLRPFVYPVLILGLLALAAFGVRQVIVGQETSYQPTTPEEAERISEEALVRSEAAVESFIDSDGDLCSLPSSRMPVDFVRPAHPDLPALVNDSEFIIIGSPVASVIEQPATGTGASFMYTSFRADSVLMGEIPSATIIVDSLQSVSRQGTALMRVSADGLDLCMPGSLLLFLNRAARADTYKVVPFASDRLLGDGIDLSPSITPAFAGYASEQELIDAVRQVAAEVQAQNLPRGLLACQARRAAEVSHPPIVCPGESFNPYRALRLDLLAAGGVTTFEPGSRVGRATVDLNPANPQVTQFLVALDVEVTLESREAIPDDVILMWFTVAPASGRKGYSMWYSPGSGFIQFLSSGSQFPAPPAFQQAMASFLATP